MKALFVISIIFFSSFLLLVTPSFGQEDESVGQHEDKNCLLWGERPCEEWKQVEKKGCRELLSPVSPDREEKCYTYYVKVCDKWGETPCEKWEIDVGKITLRNHALNSHDVYTETEKLNNLASILTEQAVNLGLGVSKENPILPSDITFDNGRVTFHIQIIITIEIVGKVRWYDPVIAVGYDYFIDHGPGVTSIKLPEGIGDNKYNLWLFNPESNDFSDSGVELVGGEKYKFKEPVRKFSIRGIEVDAELDPENQRAFPTGLAFDKTGKVSMRMVPITVDTDK